jgi:hypothetical protein
MNKTLFFSISFFLLFLSAAPVCSQELVVFSNDTALTVRSHKEKDGFIYLTLPEGEFAVPKNRVKEIRKTGAILAFSAGADPVKNISSAVLPTVEPLKKKAFKPQAGRQLPGRPPNQDSAGNNDDEGDDENASEDTDSDEDDENVSELKPPPNALPLLPMKSIMEKPGRTPSPVVRQH